MPVPVKFSKMMFWKDGLISYDLVWKEMDSLLWIMPIWLWV